MDRRLDDLLRFLRRRLERGVPYGLGFTLALVGIAAGLWGFLEIADAVTEQSDLYRFDAHAHDAVYQLVGPDRVGLVEWVTWLGNHATLTTLVVLVALALVLTKRYWSAFRVVLASAAGGLINLGLKGFFARVRPLDKVIPAEGYSFPSGHAMGATVFYGMMIYLTFRLTERAWLRALAVVVFGATALAVGFSRVYLNVHFLTDVLGGFAAGTAWLVLSLLLVDLVERRSRSRREVRDEAARPDDATPREVQG